MTFLTNLTDIWFYRISLHQIIPFSLLIASTKSLVSHKHLSIFTIRQNAVSVHHIAQIVCSVLPLSGQGGQSALSMLNSSDPLFYWVYVADSVSCRHLNLRISVQSGSFLGLLDLRLTADFMLTRWVAVQQKVQGQSCSGFGVVSWHQTADSDFIGGSPLWLAGYVRPVSWRGSLKLWIKVGISNKVKVISNNRAPSEIVVIAYRFNIPRLFIGPSLH